MTTPAALPAPVYRRASAPARFVPALDRSLARRVLGETLLLGLSADALLRNSLTGLALPAWIALAAATLLSLTWSAGRRMPRQAAAWLVTGVLLAATVAWRDAETLQLAGVLATLGALLMAAIALFDEGSALLAHRLRDTLWAAFTRMRTLAGGWAPLVLHEAVAPGENAVTTRRMAPVARAAAFAVVLLAVFGGLLRGADPIFASLVALPDVDVGIVVSHVVLTLFFAWLAAGWTRAALDQRAPAATPPAPFPMTLGALEITTALGALNALFALYMLSQLGWFFGGERFLRERTGLTAAQYARDGFFQMLVVVLLVVPLLLATRALLHDDDRALRRRHTMLAVPMVVLLAAMILSAFSRVQLYVHYYGLTTERFYPMVLMAWLGLVLIWLGLTVLRDRGARFVAGTLVSGLAVLLALDVAAPDVYVARVNIARAGAVGALDLQHLAWLGGEAAPIAVATVLAPPPARTMGAARSAWEGERCQAAGILLHRWGPASRLAARYRDSGAWRVWNAGEARALDTVRERAAALRQVRHAACAVNRGTITRGVREESD